MYQPDRVLEFYAAVARMAILDYQEGYTSGKHPDAAAFLTAAGLLTASGLRYGGIESRKKRPPMTEARGQDEKRY